MIKTENLSMVFTTEEVQTKALNEVNIEVKQSGGHYGAFWLWQVDLIEYLGNA